MSVWPCFRTRINLVGVPHHMSLKTALWMMQLMLAACVAYLLPFLLIHLPALGVHTSTSSSPMAGKAFAYSPDCQSRIIANYSFKVSLSKSGITKTVSGQLRWIGIKLFGRFQFRGDIYGKGGHVELMDGYIQHVAIKRTMGGRIDHTTAKQVRLRQWHQRQWQWR